MAVRLGLGLPQSRQYEIGRDVPDVARAAEQIGYESLWVFERALYPEPATQGLYGMEGVPWPDAYRGLADPLVTLTLAAAATERARLGTSVLVAPLHGPFQLARTLGTLDAASGGRVVAGLGTGWSLDEYAAAGVAPFAERGRVLDEILDVCRAVWGPDPVRYDGDLTKIASAVVGPKPARPIPIFLPAFSKKSLTRLVERGDGWNPIAMGAEQLAAQWRQVQDFAAEKGRTRPIETAARVNARLHGEGVRRRRPPALPGQHRPDRHRPRRPRRDRPRRVLPRLRRRPAGRRRTQGPGRRVVRGGTGGRDLTDADRP